ncbi:DUF3800 domain-containing protein [Methyloglobulus sp.]|uniref:DUF3800 domain-containing protein n=1 Tax=Methyloglobulus sp. TaxID=2518622 RepID=UPI00398943BE
MSENFATSYSYKLFCDESCHLEHDSSNVMVLGTICCPEESVEKINRQIKALRYQHSYKNELKWTQLHFKQIGFYKALIDLFLETEALRFKATVVLNKKALNHEQFNQGSHNNFYYKMFYYTLRDFLEPRNHYNIYLDYMDTQGRDKAKKLMEVLHNANFGQVNIATYIIRSHESQLIQLCDLLIGALSYSNRTDIAHESKVKNELVDYLVLKLCHRLDMGTPPWEQKFNIFRFSPRGTIC